MTEFRAIRTGDLFTLKPTKSYHLINYELFDKKGKYPVVTNSSLNNGVTGYTNYSPTMPGNIVTYSDTTTGEAIFYQPRPFVGYSHVQAFYPNHYWSKECLLYFVTAFKKASAYKYSYGTKFTRSRAEDQKVVLPFLNDSLDTAYMTDQVINAEHQYISIVKKRNHETIADYQKIFNLTNSEDISKKDKLFISQDHPSRLFKLKQLISEKPQRGLRIKSFDRVKGKIPFVTAGRVNEGISAHITPPKNLRIWQPSTVTIDMFGNVFLRNYIFAADDHVTCIRFPIFSQNTEFNHKVLLFISTAIQQVLPSDLYTHSHNFYPKDVDHLKIDLPVQTDKKSMDISYMAKYISIIERLKLYTLKQNLNRNIAYLKGVVPHE